METNGKSTVLYLARAPRIPSLMFVFRSGSTEAFSFAGATWDHFHCTVEPSPGHIRCRICNTFVSSDTSTPKEESHVWSHERESEPLVTPCNITCTCDCAWLKVQRSKSESSWETPSRVWHPCALAYHRATHILLSFRTVKSTMHQVFTLSIKMTLKLCDHARLLENRFRASGPKQKEKKRAKRREKRGKRREKWPWPQSAGQ